MLGLAGGCVLGDEVAWAEPSVWTERATTKVRPEAAPQTTRAAVLSAAKNEFEAFQIVVRDPSGVRGVAAEASSLTGPAGAEIPASAVRFYRVDLITLDQRSDAEGGTGRWPDALIPAIDDLDGTPRNGFP